MAIEPNRDADLLEGLEDAPQPSSGLSGCYSLPADDDAPFGRKPDGTPFKRRGRNRPGYDSLPSKGATGSKQYAPRRGGASLETQIGALILTVNLPIMFLSQRDALDSVEIEALAHALDQECQRNARFRKIVEQAIAVQGGTSLVLVVAAIAGRRVLRHNLIEVPEPLGNEQVDAMLGGVISMTTGKGPINANLFVMKNQETSSTES